MRKGPLGILSRILTLVLLGLVTVLVTGSLYGLLVRAREGERRTEAGEAAPPAGEAVFTNIGRIRVNAGEAEALMVILSISFPYFPQDKPFSEELASRVGELRSLSADYIASLSEEELRFRDEAEIKRELLRRYNRILRLGRIETLYFNDFMVMD
jgi:flagellar basal body-associated protein FliL